MTKIDETKLVELRALRKAGLSYGKIAQQLGLEKGTVAKRCQTDALIAEIGPKVKLYKGYFTGPVKRRIELFLRYNPLATLDDIKLGCDLDIATSTLCKFLNKNQMKLQVAKKKIVLKDVNRAKRIEFCRKVANFSDEKIKSIWFSDETIVKSRPNGEIVFYRMPKDEEWSVPSNAGGGKSVMFWACISFNAYGPLVEVKGKNTAVQYIETLSNYLLPEIRAAAGPVTFQQDNATIHKTPAVRAFFEQNNIDVLEWPPQSPDLSPIENLWNAMKMKMKALKPRPTTYATMRDGCLKIWQELDDDLRIGYMESFRERCRLCLASNGDIVKFISNFCGVKKRENRNTLPI